MNAGTEKSDPAATEAVIAEFGRRETKATLWIVAQFYFMFSLVICHEGFPIVLLGLLITLSSFMPIVLMNCSACEKSVFSAWLFSWGLKPEECPRCGVRLRPPGKEMGSLVWCMTSLIPVPILAQLVAQKTDTDYSHVLPAFFAIWAGIGVWWRSMKRRQAVRSKVQ
ncbi:MAG: hypothetical protein HZA20_14775 [Nitrospirae bacterium]|nr:hypothetical protein [Nitrospirota bacterium]